MNPAELALSFLELCETDSDPATAVRRLTSYSSQFGFSHFILTGVPPPHHRLEKYVLAVRWPEEWFRRFSAGGYVHRGAVGQWAARTCQPFLYDEIPETFRSARVAKEIFAEAQSFNLIDCLTVPIRSAWHRQSALSLQCTSRIELGPHERTALQLVAFWAERLINRIQQARRAEKCLTLREREVLAWTAEGKSAWEISVILSVSERTVTKHLEHVRAKLAVATTVQAVAEAIRCGELVL